MESTQPSPSWSEKPPPPEPAQQLNRHDNPAAGARLDTALPEGVFFEWFTWLLRQLRLVQGVDVSPESAEAIAAQIRNWPFSRLSAAQAWLFYGNPWKYRGNAKTLVLSDFCPSRDDLDRLRDVDAVIVETREQRRRSIAGQIELARIESVESSGAPQPAATDDGIRSVVRLLLDERAYCYELEQLLKMRRIPLPRRTTLEERLPARAAFAHVPESRPEIEEFKREMFKRFKINPQETAA